MSFIENVKTEMEKQNLSKNQLVTKAGINFNTFKGYFPTKKSAGSLPSIDIAAQIASALNVSLDYLCGISSVKEIKSDKKMTSNILLHNLYSVIKTTPLEVMTDSYGGVSLKSKNQIINVFLALISQIEDESSVFEVINLFNACEVLNGKLLLPYQFQLEVKEAKIAQERLKRFEYIYGDISPDDRDVDYDACAEEIERRAQIWESTNGNPPDRK